MYNNIRRNILIILRKSITKSTNLQSRIYQQDCELSAKIYSSRSPFFPNIFTKIFINFAKRYLNNPEITNVVAKNICEFANLDKIWETSERFFRFQFLRLYSERCTRSIDSKISTYFKVSRTLQISKNAENISVFY